MKVRLLKRRPLSVVPRLGMTRRSARKWRVSFYRNIKYEVGGYGYGIILWRVK